MRGLSKQALDGLNIYNILEPCYHRQITDEKANNYEQNTSIPVSFQHLGKTEKPLPVRKRMFGRAWPYQAPVVDGIVTLWPQLAESARVVVPCVVSKLAAFKYFFRVDYRALYSLIIQRWMMIYFNVER